MKHYIVTKPFECMEISANNPEGIDIGFKVGDKIVGIPCGGAGKFDVLNKSAKFCGVPLDCVRELVEFSSLKLYHAFRFEGRTYLKVTNGNLAVEIREDGTLISQPFWNEKVEDLGPARITLEGQ